MKDHRFQIDPQAELIHHPERGAIGSLTIRTSEEL
jgi:hypothetical protein